MMSYPTDADFALADKIQKAAKQAGITMRKTKNTYNNLGMTEELSLAVALNKLQAREEKVNEHQER